MFLDFFRLYVFGLQRLIFKHEKHKTNEKFVSSMYFVFRKKLCDFASLRSNRKSFTSALSRQNHSNDGAVRHR
jgi:hypothetical protein